MSLVRTFNELFQADGLSQQNSEISKKLMHANLTGSRQDFCSKLPAPFLENSQGFDINQFLITFILSNYSLPKIDMEKLNEIQNKFNQTNEGALSPNPLMELVKLCFFENYSIKANSDPNFDKTQRPMKNIIIQPPEEQRTDAAIKMEEISSTCGVKLVNFTNNSGLLNKDNFIEKKVAVCPSVLGENKENQSIFINKDDSGEEKKKIGSYTLEERRKKIQKFKDKKLKWRLSHPVLRNYCGRKRVAQMKKRIRGRFCK